jgi:hypothetical protein
MAPLIEITAIHHGRTNNRRGNIKTQQGMMG